MTDGEKYSGDEGELYERDFALLREVCQRLRHQFDTVQIFVTRDEPFNGRTFHASHGAGNSFAVYGQVSLWLGEQRPDEPTDDD